MAYNIARIYQLAVKCGMELRYLTIALVKIKTNTYNDQWVSQLQFRVILLYSLQLLECFNCLNSNFELFIPSYYIEHVALQVFLVILINQTL